MSIYVDIETRERPPASQWSRAARVTAAPRLVENIVELSTASLECNQVWR